MARAGTPGAAVETGSVVDRIADGIRTSIKTGALAPGQRLVEPDLAREYDVSRGAVREALRRLSAEDLIEVELYRGASVRRLSREELEELYRVRELLEGLAAHSAAERIEVGNNRARFKAGLETVRAAAGLTPNSYMEENLRFHQLIVDLSGNRYLDSLVPKLQVPVFRLLYSSLFEHSSVRMAIDQHDQIGQAILDRNAKAAEKAMRAHVREAGDLILKLPDRYFRRN